MQSLVFFSSVAALLFIGFWFGKSDQTPEDFFLARRQIPMWAVCVSFVAAEITALTIVGIPAIAFKENWQYAQYFVGVALARIVIAQTFIPPLYHADSTTPYELLGARFGAGAQYLSSFLFIATRLLLSGVRLMAASMAASVLLGWPLLATILLFSAAGAAYMIYGGIRAAIWANVFQAAIFTVAGIAMLAFLFRHFSWSMGEAWGIADAAGRLTLWNFGFGGANIFWLAILNGFAGALITTAADYEMMQRLMCARTSGDSRRALLLTIPASFLIMVLYLCVGTALFVYYSQHPEMALPRQLDEILPHFTVQVMPTLLRGIVLAGIFMASVDSPLTSVAGSFVVDLYRPLIRRNADNRHYVMVARIATGAASLLLAGLALFFSSHENLLWIGFKISAVTLGPMAGIFLVGLRTKRQGHVAIVAALVTMCVVNLGLLLLSEWEILPIGWNMIMAFGAFGAFGIGWGLGPSARWARAEVAKEAERVKIAVNESMTRLPRLLRRFYSQIYKNRD